VLQLDHVVGDQAVSPGNELQCQFAFADACVALDEHAGAEDFEKHAMDGGDLGQALRQVMPQMRHQHRARQFRSEQRGVGAFGVVAQDRRQRFAIGDNDGREFGRKQMGDRILQAGLRQSAQVVHFGAAEHLDPVRVDEIQVADERQGGFLHGFGRQAALPPLVSGHPVQVELFRHVAEQGLDRNVGGFIHARLIRIVGEPA